jgi:hypothetical protein
MPARSEEAHLCCRYSIGEGGNREEADSFLDTKDKLIREIPCL